eukprot:16434185-Heterocapsa_arctica.AAC.1
MQHVSEVVAGLDVVRVIPTMGSGNGTGAPGSTGSAKVTKPHPPRGGVHQNIGVHESTGSTI